MNERELFSEALSIRDPGDRAAYLDKSCAGNTALRRRVETLLKAHLAAEGFLQRPPFEEWLAAVPEPGAAGGADPTATDAVANEVELPGGQWLKAILSPSSKAGSQGRLGHYEVEAVLGHGGFGTVLRAFDERLHRSVAIKVLSPELATTSPSRKRFLREARSAAAIRHPNVVSIHAVEDTPLPYLVMEYVPGRTLQQILDDHGPLDVDDVLRIAEQIAQGLAAAHARGLIHRDIKPSNILLEGGLRGSVKISDFGLARTADDATLTRSGTVTGTPLYMSPEQAQGQSIDHRSDLFSLCSVLYVMISGRPPFRAPTTVAVLKRVVEEAPRPIAEIIPETPDWLCAIIAKLHAKTPEDRFQTAQEVGELLGKCLASLRGNRRVQLPANVPPAPRPTPAGARTQRVAGHTQISPAAPRRRTATARRWTSVAAVSLAMVAGLGLSEATGVTNLAATIIRLTTGSGTLVIETDDPGVSITIDGEAVQIRGAGVEQLTLRPGSYQVAAVKDGRPVSQQLVTIARGGREVVRVMLETDQSKSTTAPPATSAANDAERRIAEWALSKGGAVRVLVTLPGGAREYREPTTTSELPTQEFACEMIVLPFGATISDAEIERLLDARQLVRLELMRTTLSDSGLQTLSRHNSLTYLNISQTPVTDAGLKSLKRLKSLRSLVLFGDSITVDGLLALQDLPLEYVELGGTRITLPDFVDLRLFPGLQHLAFQESDVRDADLAGLAHWQQLNTLAVQKTAVSDAGLTHLKQLPELRLLYLNGCAGITDAAVDTLSQLAWLRFLNVEGTQLSADAVTRLHAALQECHITWNGGVIEPIPSNDSDRRAAEWALSVGIPVEVSIPGEQLRIAPGESLPAVEFKLLLADLRVPQGNDAGLANFAGCRNLRSVMLLGEHVTDAGAANFRLCKGLHGLCLEHTSMTDDGLLHFEGCAELTHLYLSSRGFTDRGLAVFRDCRIRVLDFAASQVTDAGLAQFRRIELLSGLDLNHTSVTDDGLYHFRGCLLLDSLSLMGTSVTDAGLDHFKNCQQLFHVDLEDTRIGDVGLSALHGSRELSVLVLNGTRVTDTGATELKNFDQLKDLQLRRTSVTAAKIEELHQSLPKCRIEWDGGVIEPQAVIDPDRRAAEWALSAGCSVELTADGQRRRVQPGESLPDGSFQLNWADISSALATPEHLAHFAGCRHVTHLNLAGDEVSDAGVQSFRDSKQLVRLSLENTSVTDAGLAAFEGCHELESLIVNNSPVTDAGVRAFAGCSKLRHLQLQQTGVSDAGLAHFANCPLLVELGLGYTSVTDAGLVHFRNCTELTHLNLISTPVSDAGMDNFRDRRELTIVVLSDTRVSDSGLACFSNFRKLVRLQLDNLGVTDAGLANFRECTGLTDLTLFGAKITDAALEPLSRCPHLTYLLLDNTQISDAGLAYLRECRQLQRLHLDNTQVGDPGLAHLANCDLLGHVTLAGTKITDAGLRNFADCRQLSWLSLSGTRVTDAGVNHLHPVACLREVNLVGTQVTADAVNDLRQALPECRITWDGGIVEARQSLKTHD